MLTPLLLLSFSLSPSPPPGVCHTCRQSLPPPQPQPHSFIPPGWFQHSHSQYNPPMQFTSAAAQQTPLPSIHEIAPSPLYPQHFHPPVSTPSPVPKESLPQFLEDSQSPTLSPSSSPGTVSNDNWKDLTPTIPPSTVSISQASELETEFLSRFSPTSTTAPLMAASPAVPSPDNTTIFQPYPFTDNPGSLQYPPYTS